jgi:hypothetical protein
VRNTMRRTAPVIVVVAALAAGVANGKQCQGITFADQAQIDGSALTLNGLGLRQATVFRVNVYVGALYLARPSNEPTGILGSNAPYRLILQFVRNVDAGDIRKSWTEGFERNSGPQLPALQDRIATLNGWMSDVKTGQQLIFTFRPGSGVQVNVNGTVKGTIAGDEFAKALLSIWLGATPPNPQIKIGMLGGACG